MIKDGRAEWQMIKIAVYMPEIFDQVLLNYALQLDGKITIISNDCKNIPEEYECLSNLKEEDFKNFHIFILRDSSFYVNDMKFYDMKNLLSKNGIKMLVVH